MKMPYTSFVTLILAIGTTSVAGGQSLSLSQALEKARTGHPSLLSAQSDVAAAEARASMRNAPFRPQMSVNGTAATGDGSMIFPSSVMPVNYSFLPTDSVGVLNGTAMWRFWTSGFAEVTQFQARLDIIAINVDFGVREAFSSLVFRKDALNAKQAALDASREMLRVTQARFDVGSAPKAYVLRAEADVAGMERELALAQADLGMADAMLREKVGLDQWGEVRVGKYSKGMLQRVGLAQALLHEPRLLILDEPTDGVDPVGRRQIRDILQALEQRGVTIFVNSHLLGEVEAFCRDVAILHKGKVVLQGRVRELTAGKGYRLTVPAPGVSDTLRAELEGRAAGVVQREEWLDLQFAERADVNAAIDVLRAAGVELEAVTPTTSTLEEVFIRSVNG